MSRSRRSPERRSPLLAAALLLSSMIFGMRRRLMGGMIATFLGTFFPVGEKSARAPALSTTYSDEAAEEKLLVHPPPPGVDYSTNPTVFGKILRGELPSRPYVETDDLYAFRDIKPSAPLHALVIPKRYIHSVKALLPSDADIVAEMKSTGESIVRTELGEDVLDGGDYTLCFHIPPFNSVGHLHLHVLAPASEMTYFKRYGKYRPGTTWCADVDDVEARLRRGERAVRSPLWGKA